MAKIASQHVVITLNKLVKDSDGDTVNVLSEEVIAQLEEVVAQLVNDESVVVEVQNG